MHNISIRRTDTDSLKSEEKRPKVEETTGRNDIIQARSTNGIFVVENYGACVMLCDAM